MSLVPNTIHGIGALSAGSDKANSSEVIELGTDVRIEYGVLQQYCWRRLTELDVDLLYLAGLVTWLDRAHRRHRSRGWARQFHVVVPVRDVARWQAPQTATALQGALAYSTGDTWDLEFVERPKSPQLKQLYLLDQLPDKPVVIPYSGGLDSFAQRRFVELEQPEKTALLIQAKTSGPVLPTPASSRAVVLPIPVHHSGLRHAEPTYRTRTFLFGVVAAVAAKLSGSRTILIGENGQGSLGASLIPFSGEPPFRTTHPLFTSKLRDFLANLWGCDSLPVFEHPNVWLTKGEVLKRLAQANALGGWENTDSCSRNIARTKSYPGVRACGICGNCLLRRMSVNSAQLSDATRYFWDNLDAATLDTACVATGHTSKTDENIANHSLVSMAGLADAAEWPSSHPTLAQLSFELARATRLPQADINERVRRLLKSHQSEWRHMTDTLRPRSWVRQKLEVLHAND